jgi:UDP-N-acetylglucosamine--N-acetylmuramyl-(pentapeptide) pyrophosphoryl-undecaprenol N-acetylglucosamine transferase
MFPAQSLAEELLRRGWRVALASDERGMRYAGGFPDQVERRELRAATTTRGGLTTKLAAPMTLLRGIWQARRWMQNDRPDAVIGFGGYPAAPAMAAAVALGIPRIIHEQNGVLGRANRLFVRRANILACGIGVPANAPKEVQSIEVGNPIRDAARAVMGQNYTAPADGPVRLLVFGGSQGASVLSEMLPPALSFLPDALRARIVVTQQAREPEISSLRDRYDAADITSVDAAPFFDDMPQRIADSHLIIARAGASTCAELAAIGRPSLLIPLPTATSDHQTANARWLESAGASVAVAQGGLTPQMLGEHIGALLTDPSRLTGMATAARSLGKPDAAKTLADLVTEVSG